MDLIQICCDKTFEEALVILRKHTIRKSRKTVLDITEIDEIGELFTRDEREKFKQMKENKTSEQGDRGGSQGEVGEGDAETFDVEARPWEEPGLISRAGEGDDRGSPQRSEGVAQRLASSEGR